MELWVRSQDKEILLNIKGIQYQNCKLVENETVEANILIGFYNYYDNEILGEYETKERALEVLDEIQRLITDLQYLNYAIKNDEFCSYRPNVYEMPEK
jgi:ABC-type sugar transport system ATPase subunit